VQAALDRLAEAGLSGRFIPVACGFHSPLVADSSLTFGAELRRQAFDALQLPVWSNTTAAPYPTEPAAVREILAAHVAQPVRWVEQIEAMYATGVRVFVEAGPGRVLTQLVDAILHHRPHIAVATDVPGESGLRRLLLTVAELAAAGVPVDPSGLFRGRDASTVSVSAMPCRPNWLVNGHLVRTTDGQYLPGGLRPTQRLAAQDSIESRTESRSDAAVLEFLRTTRELVAVQREVMLGYLGSAAHLLAESLTVALPPAPTRPVPVQHGASDQMDDGESGPPPEGADHSDLTPETVMASVRSLVSERTGYPVDMLEADLDLEADLSIDSIKRTEIIGVLTDRLGLARSGTALNESVVEELTQLRTLRRIADWITREASRPRQTTPPQRVRRYLVETSTLPPLHPAGGSLIGRRITIVGDGAGIGLGLSEALERQQAQVRLLSPDQAHDESATDALVYLAALDRGRAPVLPDGFGVIRDALLSGVGQLMLVTGSGGRFGRTDNANGVAGIGLPGLARAIASEFPDRLVHAVDVDPKEEPSCITEYLLAELLSSDGPIVVGYAAGTRATLALSPAPLGRSGLADLGLGPDSVVLLTGGARGITAQVAIGLARASGGHLELVGRTPLPIGDEDPVTAAATDRIALRRVLAQDPDRTPAGIDSQVSRILAQREIRTTLAELAGVAASVRYSAVDVRNPLAVTALLNDVYYRHGRLDGIVHGAGVLADRRLGDKTPEEFTEVWATKVDGARALASATREDLGFLMLFGSVSGVFGNRGQADYAAANDALDALARIWANRSRGRVVSVDWGPWAAPGDETGMVSAELARKYERSGIGLINPADGVECLLAELTSGTDPQVVYMCADAAAFEGDQHG
jgi:malonyl CoA-acyl carrier protein transacylase/NADP-dependent 3-hydroxy acid dehydrogenase YdfG